MKKRNMLIAQSGGPSAAINATLAGVIAAAQKSPEVDRILGSRHGIEGVLREECIDLTDFADLEKLKATPAMALGSCRFKLPADFSDPMYEKIAKCLEDMNVGYFMYIGGNDSMDTVSKLSDYYAGKPDAPVVVGLPKTIDNDLPGCDHTPGFGSAARYLAITVEELIRDISIYALQSVTIVEIMGRDAGWLTLAAGLPRLMGGQKPDLIAIPEVTFDENAFLDFIRGRLKETHNIIAVVSEGIRDANGDYVGSAAKSGAVDNFGHVYLSGVGKYLEGLVKREIGCKVRSIEVNLMQRCAGHAAALSDIEESFAVGQHGVAMAEAGISGRMAAIQRAEGEEYSYYCDSVDIKQCANKERPVPPAWFDLEDPQVKKEICAYLLPLIKGAAPQYRDEYGFADYVIFEEMEH